MRIIYTQLLAQAGNISIRRLSVRAPDIARKAMAGQFVMVMARAEGERIPLTIVEADQAQGIITLIFQEVGLTTKLLAKLKKGDDLYALVGPLGHPTKISNYGRVILVAGGVGIAEIYPIAKALKEAGNYVVTVAGARTKELLILENELNCVSDELHIVTDDGSYGKKGFTTDILKELLNNELRTTNYELVYAVGPLPMMKKVSLITKSYSLKTIVSLNSLMVDATGMCGCCRVTVAGKTKFSCVDGPEFDAHLVDWEELSAKNAMYVDKEKHICRYG